MIAMNISNSLYYPHRYQIIQTNEHNKDTIVDIIQKHADNHTIISHFKLSTFILAEVNKETTNNLKTKTGYRLYILNNSDLINLLVYYINNDFIPKNIHFLGQQPDKSMVASLLSNITNTNNGYEYLSNALDDLTITGFEVFNSKNYISISRSGLFETNYDIESIKNHIKKVLID
jgi:diacylglycerol kinase family enzyme